MPRALRFTLIGCGGLLVLFVLLVACTALLAGNQDSPTEKAEEEAGVEEAEKSPAPAPPPPPAPAEKKEEAEAITIRVSGTPGTPFSGNYGKVDSSRSVDGVIPAEYEVEVDTGFLSFDSVTAVMQKQSQGNEELSVQMLVDDEVIKEQSTTAAFGVVTVNLTPTEIQEAA